MTPRSAALARLGSETFDLLVIGGGINGAGIARDAAMRGLRTALVEHADFGSGTSSRSSKLIHGGFRYLEQGDVRLVLEACRERERPRSPTRNGISARAARAAERSERGVRTRRAPPDGARGESPSLI